MLNAKTSANGVLKITIPGGGMLKVSFGDRAEFEVDIIKVNDEMALLAEAYKDGKTPANPIGDAKTFGEALTYYVASLAGYMVSEAEALSFNSGITLEVEKIRPFFDVRMLRDSSCPGSSDTNPDGSD